jgi:excisionase family DNA binding protein
MQSRKQQTAARAALPAMAAVAWHDRPNVPIQTAANVIGCSRSKVYSLAASGDLAMVRLAGRTLVVTASILRFVSAATPYVPDGTSPRGAARTRAAMEAA